MDIAALSSSMSQASLAQAVSIRVMALAKNTAEQQSQNVVQLLSQNIHPNLGKNLDIKG
ncbi:YjfB family protein [Paenibacillus contaminans]|uniref:Putative motility protein n=1 Tax=Paenibacillus contaminans TaxID=450362 RepID=A0A329MQQ5_9BACL|nr:YjfB family protein [Paenibacillus contaminans]RAV22269.1 putative motility protein [Paenibacillus contaminans]